MRRGVTTRERVQNVINLILAQIRVYCIGLLIFRGALERFVSSGER